jgi:hypothetical protein
MAILFGSAAQASPLPFGEAIEELVLAPIEFLGREQPIVELSRQLGELGADGRGPIVLLGRGIDHSIDGPERETGRCEGQGHELGQ